MPQGREGLGQRSGQSQVLGGWRGAWVQVQGRGSHRWPVFQRTLAAARAGGVSEGPAGDAEAAATGPGRGMHGDGGAERTGKTAEGRGFAGGMLAVVRRDKTCRGLPRVLHSKPEAGVRAGVPLRRGSRGTVGWASETPEREHSRAPSLGCHLLERSPVGLWRTGPGAFPTAFSGYQPLSCGLALCHFCPPNLGKTMIRRPENVSGRQRWEVRMPQVERERELGGAGASGEEAGVSRTCR